MADFMNTHGSPGIAAYNTETWGNVREVRIQDTPATAVDRRTITNGGDAELLLPIWSVVSATGLALQSPADAIGILGMPLFIPVGESVDVDLIVAGHYDYKALNFHSSFATDAQRREAFRGRPSPLNIILSTNPYDSDGVLAN